jgi:hypothetical protein
MRSDSKSRGCSGTEFWDPPGTGRVDRAIGCRRASTYPKPTPRACWNGDVPDFVEVGEAGIAVDDAMRHELCVQLVRRRIWIDELQARL